MKLMIIITRLIAYPVLSLALSYAALRAIDATSSRMVVYILSACAVMLPIVTLAYGILSLSRLKKTLHIALASLISSMTWVVISVVANRFLQGEDIGITFEQSLISVASFTILSTGLILIGQYIWKKMHKQSKTESANP